MGVMTLRKFELAVSSTGAVSIKGSTRELGRVGEVEATQLVVHVGGWTQAFDNAVYSVLVRLPDQSTWPLIAGATPVDDRLTVVIPPAVFSMAGNVTFEVRAERDGRRMKSSTVEAAVYDALATGSTPPSVGRAWTDQLTGLVARLDADVPRVYIEGDYLTGWGGKGDERLARLSYRSAVHSFDCVVRMKPQGTSSLNYPKKNLTLWLYEDEALKKKKPIAVRAGWGAQSRYVLKADWVDPTHACNVVSARLAAGMQARYGLFPNAPNRGLIDGFPVVVHMNGQCVGLYNWTIPKDGWLFDFEDEEEETALILCAETQTGSCAFRERATFQDWSVEFGREDDAALATFNRMVDFVKESSDTDFREQMGQYLNLDACLNYYCFAYVSAATDNLGKNMLMVSADRQVWSPSLYDLDSLWGVIWDGVTTIGYDRKCPEEYDCPNSLLWAKLVRCFPNELASRYEALRNGALSTATILSAFEAYIGRVPKRLYDEDIKIWPGIGSMTRDLDQIRAYLPARTQYVDFMIRNLRTTATGSPGRVLYNLPEPFIGDGVGVYVDTGIRLFDNPDRDWTLILRFANTILSEEKVLCSCFSEIYPNYEGLLIRRDYSCAGNEVNVIVGKNHGGVVPGSTDAYAVVAVVKHRHSYRIFKDGNLISERANTSLAVPYMGSLLIGCQDDGGYNKFRFSAVTVSHLTVYQKALSDADVLALMAAMN